MLVTKTSSNSWIVKLYNNNIDIYNIEDIKNFTKNIITKIVKKNNLSGIVNLEVYIDNYCGLIINIINKKASYTNKEINVKISFNINSNFLYEIDYFNIVENKLLDQNIYYYKDKFYLELNKKISKKKYYKLLELSNIIYIDTFKITNIALKL